MPPARSQCHQPKERVEQAEDRPQAALLRGAKANRGLRSLRPELMPTGDNPKTPQPNTSLKRPTQLPELLRLAPHLQQPTPLAAAARCWVPQLSSHTLDVILARYRDAEQDFQGSVPKADCWLGSDTASDLPSAATDSTATDEASLLLGLSAPQTAPRPGLQTKREVLLPCALGSRESYREELHPSLPHTTTAPGFQTRLCLHLRVTRRQGEA